MAEDGAGASSGGLRVVGVGDVGGEVHDPVDAKARTAAEGILADVRAQGMGAVLRHATRLGDLEDAAAKHIYTRDDLKEAYDALDSAEQQLLVRTAERVRFFAAAQRDAVTDIEVPIPGGVAGHRVAPVAAAGCYAPGGRYPLPSSVIMTAVTARAAGVPAVWVASPRPAPATLAAAHVAEADGLLAVGGAQAIGALAYGVEGIPKVDVIVGPGNKWVTAAKSLVAGVCAIDMLAGPSEVLVIVDDSADADTVAADLLAQAEHDTEARPILVSTSDAMIGEVNAKIAQRLSELPTAETAREAVAKGFAVKVADVGEAVRVSDQIAPEHLEVQTVDARAVGLNCTNYGALFVGSLAAEVLGDYGAGPNHVLPTGGTARYCGGLSVNTFLRVRTFMELTDAAAAQETVRDAVALARVEGLEGHARAAECRLAAADAEDGNAAKRRRV